MESDRRQASGRHCMVVFAYYPIGETRVQREAEALVRSGLDVDILCLRHPTNRNYRAPRESVGGTTVYRLPVGRSGGDPGLVQQFLEYALFLWLSMVALIGLHLRHRYDVVQVHNLPDFLVFAAWFPKLLGARIILDLHDLMPEFFAARFGRGAKRLLRPLVVLQEQLSCGFADHVITVTERWRQALIRRGVPASKTSVVMNLPDEAIFDRSTHSWSLRTGDEFRLVYHGAIPARYGLDLVLDAVARLKDEIAGLSFTVYSGGGHDREVLVDLARRLGITDRVHFRSAVLATELPALLCQADVGVVPYKRGAFTDDLLPTKLLEYTALGIPSIMSRTSAVEAYFSDDMVEYFESESVEELVSAIRRLYYEPERLLALSQQSDRFNLLYNWTVESASYTALVSRLARGRRRALVDAR